MDRATIGLGHPTGCRFVSIATRVATNCGLAELGPGQRLIALSGTTLTSSAAMHRANWRLLQWQGVIL